MKARFAATSICGVPSAPATAPAFPLNRTDRARHSLALSLLFFAALLVSGCKFAKPVSAGPESAAVPEGAVVPNSVAVPASAAIDPQKYYAVLLINGSVYFGHLEGLGSAFPVLRDVFYVRPGPVDPKTHKPSGMILVHRG